MEFRTVIYLYVKVEKVEDVVLFFHLMEKL